MSEYKVVVESYPTESGERPKSNVRVFLIDSKGEREAVRFSVFDDEEIVMDAVKHAIFKYEHDYGYSFKMTTHGD